MREKNINEEKTVMQQKNRYKDIFDNSKLKSQFMWDIITTQKPCNNEVKIIPKIIIQYWDDSNNIPSDVLECMGTWKNFSGKEIQYILFDKKSARTFIDNNFTKRHVDAFDNCFHPALQSDYFRLCYIFINGGVYIDADDECMCDDIEFLFMGDVLKIQAMCYDLETEQMVNTTQAYEGAFSDNRIYYVNNNPLIAVKNNPIVKKALEMATDNLLKPLSNDFQLIAGPGNLVNSVIWCKLNEKNFDSIINIDIGWDDKVISKWPLEYRNDTRNWRNIKLDKR